MPHYSSDDFKGKRTCFFFLYTGYTWEELLEENDDVQDIWHNWEMPEE